MRDPNFDAGKHIEARRGYLEQVSENASRQAWVYAGYTTTGMGEYADESAVDFGLAFFNQPRVSHGCCLTEDSDELKDGFFPQTTGGVYQWDINEKGLYVGAWLFMTVVHEEELDDEEDPVVYVVQHDFTFAGIGMKDVSKKLLNL